jgi:hypothetical protein
MVNKKFWLGMLVLILVFGMTVFISCSSVASALEINQDYSTRNFDVGENESVVIVKRNNYYGGSAATINIFVDDELVARIRNGKETSFTVKNGNHTIKAGNAILGSGTQAGITFDANSQIITFAVGYEGMSGIIKFIRGKTFELEKRKTN